MAWVTGQDALYLILAVQMGNRMLSAAVDQARAGTVIRADLIKLI